ncbi:MAG: alpha/beta hydrolase [Fusobacteriaceae bacterium]|jgi:acetyl esterase/lipase|nr:alpha/beta hydrolase [Fusobacteriaceae bacterium]
MKKYEVRQEIKEYLQILNEITIPALLKAGYKINPINNRESFANMTKALTPPGPQVKSILDDYINAPEYRVPVRIFNPDPDKALPILIYYHGGGGMSGSVVVYDPIYRRMAEATSHIVIAPEYRLSPENPYPAGETDAYNVVLHIRELLDSLNIKYKNQISIGGDSHGGTLSSAIVRKAQFDKNVSIYSQVLIYPCTDHTLTLPAIVENGAGYMLTIEKLKWYFDNYFSNNENKKERSSLYGEITKNIPKTLILTAQFCPLRDDGVIYGEKLKEVGVEVEIYNFDNMIHAFLNMESLCKEECDLLYKMVSDFLNK